MAASTGNLLKVYEASPTLSPSHGSSSEPRVAASAREMWPASGYSDAADVARPKKLRREYFGQFFITGSFRARVASELCPSWKFVTIIPAPGPLSQRPEAI